MAFRIRSSHIAATLFAGAVIGWMATGDVVVGGQANSSDATLPPAAREEAQDELFQVRYSVIEPQERQNRITIRGRSEADSIISVRAETAGTVRERLVDKGDHVEDGDVVCRLDQGTRKSALAQAEAALSQAEFDYQANLTLQDRGFASSTQVNALKAARDAAQAQLDQAEEELARTEISATASGIVQSPLAEVGDNLSNGDVCVTLIDTDPMLFVGQVSERRIGQLKVGDTAQVTFVSGESREGAVRYVAPSADPQTRTFLVEVALDNADGTLRDGVTASADITLASAPAFLVRSSWLVLADDGAIGLRRIGADDRVEFVPIDILAQTGEGVWVNGPEPGDRIISLGQDYVIAGERVDPVAETAGSAENTDPTATGSTASAE